MSNLRDNFLESKTSKLNEENSKLQKEINKQEEEIKQLEEIYKKEMERHQKLLLEKEQFDMENERFDFLIAEVDKEREKLVDFEKKLRNRTTHRISECFSKNSVLNLKSPLKDNIKDLNIIYNDVKNYFNGNPEESCCKIKDRLIEKLKIEEKRNEDLRKRLNFSRARIASKNPLGISYQALNQWTIDIKKIMQDKTLECQKKYHLNKD